MSAIQKPSNRVVHNVVMIDDSQAGMNSRAVYPNPCTFLRAFATNTSGSNLYLMVFDATSLPTNGTAPRIRPVLVAANSQATLDISLLQALGLYGLMLNTGLVWAASTTAGTLTADGTNSMWVTAQFFS
jgi:hypothetical protein